jgi:hypothetical protein
MSNKSNKEQIIAVLMENGELIATCIVLLPMMSGWIKEQVHCPIYQEDMIWFRYTIRCLTTMTKSYC